MREEADAVRLAKALVEVGEAAGLPIVTLISDLEQVLGDAVGNALQIFEVIAFLKGTKQEARVREVVLAIAAEMVVLAGVSPDMAAARALAEAKLADGSAAERFGAMVAALGGPADLMLNPDRHLDKAEVVAPVFSLTSGFVQSMDCWVIGMALVAMGAGRTNPEDKIDYAVGISQTAHLGDEVSEEVPLCMLHARSQKQWEQAAAAIREAFAVGAQPITPPPVFRQRFASY